MLKRIPTEIFENLSNLTSFSLENNPLITLESDQFSSFVKLKTLNLMKTSLDDFPPLQTENNVCKYRKLRRDFKLILLRSPRDWPALSHSLFKLETLLSFFFLVSKNYSMI